MSVYRATVVRTNDSGVFVRIPQGPSPTTVFGPCPTTVGGLGVSDPVIVSELDGRFDRYIIIGVPVPPL